MGRKEVAQAMSNLNDELDAYRNDVIEEVALALEEFTVPFGQDTVASFASYIRQLKTEQSK